MKKVHELKTWPAYWDALQNGTKTFEVRKLDRLFGVGDTLHLKEWSPTSGYSGREMLKEITYVMTGGQWGLAEGNCILGILPRSSNVEDAGGKIHWYENEQAFIRRARDLYRKTGGNVTVTPNAPTQGEDKREEAGAAWEEYIKQFSELDKYWSGLPEITATWLAQQVDIFAGKYPLKKVETGVLTAEQMLAKHFEANYDGRLTKPIYSGNQDHHKLLWILPAMEEYATQFTAQREEANLRPAVKWFAEQMELALRKNDHKTGWLNDDWDELHDRILEEAKELYSAAGKLQKDKAAIISEAADVPNFAMMIADQFGNRYGQTPATPPTKEGERGEKEALKKVTFITDGDIEAGLVYYDDAVAHSAQYRDECDRLKELIKEGFMLLQKNWQRPDSLAIEKWNQFKTDNNL